MSATMDQEPSEAAGQSPPPLLGHTATGNPPSWSTLPFTGSPNMAFAVYSPAGITSAGIASADLPPPLQLATTGTKCTTSYLSPAPLLEDFLAHYEHHAFTTDLLMIGHLPLNLSHREFCDTMDVIQRQFSISTINNFYSTAEFGLRFRHLPSPLAYPVYYGLPSPVAICGVLWLALVKGLLRCLRLEFRWANQWGESPDLDLVVKWACIDV